MPNLARSFISWRLSLTPLQTLALPRCNYFFGVSSDNNNSVPNCQPASKPAIPRPKPAIPRQTHDHHYSTRGVSSCVHASFLRHNASRSHAHYSSSINRLLPPWFAESARTVESTARMTATTASLLARLAAVRCRKARGAEVFVETV